MCPLPCICGLIAKEEEEGFRYHVLGILPSLLGNGGGACAYMLVSMTSFSWSSHRIHQEACSVVC